MKLLMLMITWGKYCLYFDVKYNSVSHGQTAVTCLTNVRKINLKINDY